MRIRNKILIYFSTTVIVLSGISLMIVFVLFSEHREEEFQQQQFSKIKYTVGLVEEFEKISAEVSLLLDKQDIHDFYDEKLLIYDHQKDLIFSSIDSLNISKADSILDQLSVDNQWIETKEDAYDLIGVYIESNDNIFYGISKAYDYFGYSKRDFLRNVLFGIFVAIIFIVLIISFYLSNIIAKPISELTKKIENYDFNNEQNQWVQIQTSTSELQNLSDKFNELTQRTREAFLFQKNSIQHISHELKTPISVLVSELEKLENHDNVDQIKSAIRQQTKKAKSLGNIINVLLQISKIDAGQKLPMQKIRIDDVIFDCIDEINSLHPDFIFEVHFKPLNFDENKLNILANQALIKQAFLNLLMNAVHYSESQKAKITFDSQQENLKIMISNAGKTLSQAEQKYLFSHFFRGENAKNHQGFGLGLVLSQRIFNFHQAEIQYEAEENAHNIFVINFHSITESD